MMEKLKNYIDLFLKNRIQQLIVVILVFVGFLISIIGLLPPKPLQFNYKIDYFMDDYYSITIKNTSGRAIEKKDFHPNYPLEVVVFNYNEEVNYPASAKLIYSNIRFPAVEKWDSKQSILKIEKDYIEKDEIFCVLISHPVNERTKIRVYCQFYDRDGNGVIYSGNQLSSITINFIIGIIFYMVLCFAIIRCKLFMKLNKNKKVVSLSILGAMLLIVTIIFVQIIYADLNWIQQASEYIVP